MVYKPINLILFGFELLSDMVMCIFDAKAFTNLTKILADHNKTGPV